MARRWTRWREKRVFRIAYALRMPSPEVTALIEKAIRDRLVLRVTYRAVDGAEGANEIDPLAIRFNHAKHRVLWCWSHGAGHVEELLWDGIQDAAVTGETFAPHPWLEP